MGSPDNITEQTFVHLGEHWNKSLKETKLAICEILRSRIENRNNEIEEDSYLSEIFTKAANAWGQSKDEAIKNTFRLLKQQIEKK